jgi:hypothetical protein
LGCCGRRRGPQDGWRVHRRRRRDDPLCAELRTLPPAVAAAGRSGTRAADASSGTFRRHFRMLPWSTPRSTSRAAKDPPNNAPLDVAGDTPSRFEDPRDVVFKRFAAREAVEIGGDHTKACEPRRRPLGDPHRLPPQKQRPPLPPEAAGGRQKQPLASQRDANPTHRASASASWPWLPAGPDRNFMWRAPTIARTISASQCSAISVPDGSRSVTARVRRRLLFVSNRWS